MPYQIVRFQLKALNWEREVGLVRSSPVVDACTPEIGEIVEVAHHGPIFRARVVWRSRGRDGIVRLRVTEI